MTEIRKKITAHRIFGLVPVVAALTFIIFVGCDPGDSPDPPTGPASAYDPLLDEARPGVTARVRPSSVLTPDPTTGNAATVSFLGIYRDPNGNPQAGLQMNFTSDGAEGAITFNPNSAFTDGNGVASTEVTVATSITAGSYTLVAYTSPASGGPNARGLAELTVNLGEIVSAPNTPSGNTSPADTLIGVAGVNTGPVTYSTSGSSSNLGNAVVYRFDCGNGTVTGFLAAGVTSTTCTYTSAGSFSVRAQAQSSTGVTSEWSEALTVTVTDTL